MVQGIRALRNYISFGAKNKLNKAFYLIVADYWVGS